MQVSKILQSLRASGNIDKILDLLDVDNKQVYQDKVEDNAEKIRVRFREAYRDNPERFRAYAQKWRDTHREAVREYSRRYYAEHREEILERRHIAGTIGGGNRRYYQKNKDKIKAYYQSVEFKEHRRQWREVNRDRINQQKRERYAKHRETILVQNKASRDRAKERRKQEEAKQQKTD